MVLNLVVYIPQLGTFFIKLLTEKKIIGRRNKFKGYRRSSSELSIIFIYPINVFFFAVFPLVGGTIFFNTCAKKCGTPLCL